MEKQMEGKVKVDASEFSSTPMGSNLIIRGEKGEMAIMGSKIWPKFGQNIIGTAQTVSGNAVYLED